MSVLAMFPLGTVLFPAMPLGLHVFEPRYRALMAACIAGAEQGEPPELGVVLIERGSEVGGGDQRFTVGTVARLTEVAHLPDGRYYAVGVGTRRVAVRSWLPDDPYPCAEVGDLDDLHFDVALDQPLRERAEEAVRRCLSLRSELGLRSEGSGGRTELAGSGGRAEPAGSGGRPQRGGPLELDPEPVAAAWQLAAACPLGELDKLALLRADSCTDLLRRLADLADEEAAVLAFRLGSN